jgi:hypothetical protein
MAEQDAVIVELTSDEGLVLFDLLHRWEDGDLFGAPQHQAVALWSLSAIPERGES